MLVVNAMELCDLLGKLLAQVVDEAADTIAEHSLQLLVFLASLWIAVRLCVIESRGKLALDVCNHSVLVALQASLAQLSFSVVKSDADKHLSGEQIVNSSLHASDLGAGAKLCESLVITVDHVDCILTL